MTTLFDSTRLTQELEFVEIRRRHEKKLNEMYLKHLTQNLGECREMNRTAEKIGVFFGVILFVILIVTVALPLACWAAVWTAQMIFEHGLPLWSILPWPKGL